MSLTLQVKDNLIILYRK